VTAASRGLGFASARALAAVQMYRVFNNGRMGMVPTGPWEVPDIVSAKVDYGVVPMPTYGGQPVTISGPDTWMLFNNGGDRSKAATFERLKERVMHSEAVSHAETELLMDDVGDKLAKLEQEDEIDRMLAEMKTRRGVAN